MRVLVLGQGGREHAIVKALHFSNSVTEVHITPGNDGIVEAISHDVALSDFSGIEQLCKQFEFDLVIIGPEQPLVDGLSNHLRERGVNVFGPDTKAAQLEGSKVVCKQFLQAAGVPTARFNIVDSVSTTLQAAEAFSPPYVLKVDGLAAGKGVFICQTLEELTTAAGEVFESQSFGEAGQRALLEEHQKGYELSYFILTNGEGYVPMPLAQDHKRIGEGETGPNTGGMGTVAPIAISPEDHQKIIETVLVPTVAELRRTGMDYRGVLFVGLMMTDAGPSVLEFNVRFGDPETQVLLPLLEGDWGEAFLAVAKGELPQLQWKDMYTACVVMAAEGYPTSSVKGTIIDGDPLKQTSSSYFLHAGTKKSEAGWQVNGGRVLNCIGIGADFKEAVKKSYALSESVNWPGMQMRRDIGKRFL